MRSYDEVYLKDAQRSIGSMYHHVIVNKCLDPDWYSRVFAGTREEQLFCEGAPWLISGMSGIELAEQTLRNMGRIPWDQPIEGVTTIKHGPEYWAGWALAYYQWYSARTFERIFEVIPFSEILGMYHPYHEMDIMSFVEEMDRMYEERRPRSRLKMYRENLGISQSELAERSEVSLRSIQLYEQGVNDIDKAQAKTLYRLSKALGRDIPDLLEDPLKD